MAERWQQWMPFHIDRFRGSPDVQAMHPAARMGYLYLLASAWQTDDCTVPDDALDLAALSGLGDELWALYGPRILRKFASDDQGRLLNHVLHDEWSDAKRIYDARRAAAQHTTKVRSPRNKTTVTVDNSNGHRTVTDGTPLRSADTQTLTGTDTSTGTTTKAKEQKPSRSKVARDVDPRHKPFMLSFLKYVKDKTGLEGDWDGREAKALSTYLAGTPKMTQAHWEQILDNRARSDIAHGQKLSAWISTAKTFYNHPLDRFGKPKNGGMNGNPTRSERAVETSREALELLANLPLGTGLSFGNAQAGSDTGPVLEGTFDPVVGRNPA